MKAQLITFAAVVLLSTNAVADKESDALCELYTNVARDVMEARQKDLPMPKVMEIYGSADKGFGAVGRAMVRDAYDEPSWGSEDRKAQAAREFANDFASDCYRIYEGR